MLNALKGLGYNQFEYARWAEQGYDKYKFIRVEVVSENEARWSTAIQNIMTTEDSTYVRTAYEYPYKPRQHLFFRNAWYEITAVGEITQDVNPQALGLVCGARMFVLELHRVNGYDVK